VTFKLHSNHPGGHRKLARAACTAIHHSPATVVLDNFANSTSTRVHNVIFSPIRWLTATNPFVAAGPSAVPLCLDLSAPHQCPYHVKCSTFDAIPNSIKPLMNIMFILGGNDWNRSGLVEVCRGRYCFPDSLEAAESGMGFRGGFLCGLAEGAPGRISCPDQFRPPLHGIPTRNLLPTSVDELHNSPQQRSAAVIDGVLTEKPLPAIPPRN
jgi:hypothetical protein